MKKALLIVENHFTIKEADKKLSQIRDDFRKKEKEAVEWAAEQSKEQWEIIEKHLDLLGLLPEGYETTAENPTLRISEGVLYLVDENDRSSKQILNDLRQLVCDMADERK